MVCDRMGLLSPTGLRVVLYRTAAVDRGLVLVLCFAFERSREEK